MCDTVTIRTTRLTYYLTLDDELPCDFHAKVTRRGRSHGITRPARRRLVYRRMGVLAAAIAVPAMAAPDFTPTAGTLRLAMPQTAEYSPAPPALVEADMQGPAQLPVAGGLAQQAAPNPGILNAGTLNPGTLNPGPAAASFMMAGSYTDRSRAEQCLTMAVYYEAASESDDGQRAVAQVVMNRVSHPSYPDNICGVVFQGWQRKTGCQFTFTCDGSLARQPAQAGWRRAARVARASLGGYVFRQAGLATHYHTLAVNPYWASSLDPVAVIGAHRFYRWRGVAGTSGAFHASYSGNEQLPFTRGGQQDEAVPAAATPAPIMAATTHSDAALPAATAAQSPAQPAGRLPASGSVLAQYARSGTWLVQP